MNKKQELGVNFFEDDVEKYLIFCYCEDIKQVFFITKEMVVFGSVPKPSVQNDLGLFFCKRDNGKYYICCEAGILRLEDNSINVVDDFFLGSQFSVFFKSKNSLTISMDGLFVAIADGKVIVTKKEYEFCYERLNHTFISDDGSSQRKI